ncbi:HAD family hydrolase [Corynebacterium pseudopelargi]|uniref:Phosphorylated carbohydrates phosphatase n=1 Tax=Corynebacterium pseudopelargi TaxID=2080757 RepID=A0A3G6ITU4_9CORY|nr:HAD family phosphatase [Corynebacterium pseudopelargi]AZA09043.1 Phosphorylated carbohydrates phosphatase [Corynebacterium pseudopelargi]
MNPPSNLVEQALSFEGWLLDFNGTLSDDEAMLQECYNKALSALGKPLAPGEYLEVCGLSEYDLARTVLQRRGISEDHMQAFIQQVAGYYREAALAQPPITHASVKLIHTLLDQGFPIAIVTGTIRPMILPVLEAVGLQALIPTLTTAEDTSAGKPNPEGFLRGAQILGIQPARILAFEDSSDGMAAASAAGMQCVHIGGDTTALHAPSFDSFAQEALQHQSMTSKDYPSGG